ncbi:MAG: glycosyltransferase family 4 protein [Candidatus Marinimicrobia bacterium]|nr:glycosyltransferase family 4 protein [Candidatus Neomarinimicrobiota bacterium]
MKENFKWGKRNTVIKLAGLFSHPIQYFVPLFKELASRPEINLTIYYCSRQGLEPSFDHMFGQSFKWDIPLLEGYHYVFLPNLRRRISVKGFFSLINPSIIRELNKGRYDAILVHGYEHATKWIAFLASTLSGIKIMFHGESHLEAPRSNLTIKLKEILLRPLFRGFDVFLYIGERNREYYKYYGVKYSQLFFTPYTVDNSFFRRAKDKIVEKRNEIRKSFGILDNNPVILFIGKLYNVKQPILLLDAFYRVRKEFPCHLLIVGDGELRSDIEAEICNRGIPDVKITGFLNQTKIPEAYVAGDVFVLPSSKERWGITVNEAMNYSLPIVVSDRVGCAPDLVKQDINGYIVQHDSVHALANAIEKLVLNDNLRKSFGERSLEIIENWNIKLTADGIIEALNF